jgi:hypothetical protein
MMKKHLTLVATASLLFALNTNIFADQVAPANFLKDFVGSCSQEIKKNDAGMKALMKYNIKIEDVCSCAETTFTKKVATEQSEASKKGAPLTQSQIDKLAPEYFKNAIDTCALSVATAAAK